MLGKLEKAKTKVEGNEGQVAKLEEGRNVLTKWETEKRIKRRLEKIADVDALNCDPLISMPKVSPKRSPSRRSQKLR